MKIYLHYKVNIAATEAALLALYPDAGIEIENFDIDGDTAEKCVLCVCKININDASAIAAVAANNCITEDMPDLPQAEKKFFRVEESEEKMEILLDFEVNARRLKKAIAAKYPHSGIEITNFGSTSTLFADVNLDEAEEIKKLSFAYQKTEYPSIAYTAGKTNELYERKEEKIMTEEVTKTEKKEVEKLDTILQYMFTKTLQECDYDGKREAVKKEIENLILEQKTEIDKKIEEINSLLSTLKTQLEGAKIVLGEPKE